MSKEARSNEKLSPQRKAHLSALESILDEPKTEPSKGAADKEATAKEPSKETKAEPAKKDSSEVTPDTPPAGTSDVTPDTPPASGPGVIDFAQRTADGAKVAADRIKGAANIAKQSIGARTAIDSARRSTEQGASKASRGLHGVATLAGAANIALNGSAMNATEIAATGSGIAADTAGALDNGGKAVKATSKLGKTLGAARAGIAKYAGPLGIAAKGVEGFNQMTNGETKGVRTEGAFKTVTALGTGSVSAASWAGGAARFAAKTNVVGAAAISGIEGVSQLARSESTQDTIAGSLKTGAAAALTAAAIPGPHSAFAPLLAIGGAGMYAGGMIADNWDGITSFAKGAGNTIASGASLAGDAIANGWNSLFD